MPFVCAHKYFLHFLSKRLDFLILVKKRHKGSCRFDVFLPKRQNPTSRMRNPNKTLYYPQNIANLRFLPHTALKRHISLIHNILRQCGVALNTTQHRTTPHYPNKSPSQKLLKKVRYCAVIVRCFANTALLQPTDYQYSYTILVRCAVENANCSISRIKPIGHRKQQGASSASRIYGNPHPRTLKKFLPRALKCFNQGTPVPWAGTNT